MKVLSMQDAQERLADAIWWFKGFAAGRPPSIDEGSGEHLNLENQCREVRIMLGRLLSGEQRYLGDGTAGTLIAISLSELERVTDFLSDVGGVLAVRNHRDRSLQLFNELREIAAVTAEQEARANPDIPF